MAVFRSADNHVTLSSNYPSSTYSYVYIHTYTITLVHTLQKLSDILTEKESIQAEYTKLAGELDLTESELMAARDRISKLLKHLET